MSSEKHQKEDEAASSHSHQKEAEAASPHSHPLDEWTTQDVIEWAAKEGFVTMKMDIHRLLK